MEIPSEILRYLLSTPLAMPEAIWFVPLGVLVVLGATAAIDAYTGRVPDWLLFLGATATLYFSVFNEGQAVAVKRSIVAFVTIGVLYLLNGLYYRVFKKDAYGFGDVKWSGLAVFVFGLKSLLWAWCIGAWLGLAWMGGRKLLGMIWPQLRGEGYIHFAPFLLLGLLYDLYAKQLF